MKRKRIAAADRSLELLRAEIERAAVKEAELEGLLMAYRSAPPPPAPSVAAGVDAFTSPRRVSPTKAVPLDPSHQQQDIETAVSYERTPPPSPTAIAAKAALTEALAEAKEARAEAEASRDEAEAREKAAEEAREAAERREVDLRARATRAEMACENIKAEALAASEKAIEVRRGLTHGPSNRGIECPFPTDRVAPSCAPS